MFNQENQAIQSGTAYQESVTFDGGLRAHMIRIFNTVGLGLTLSGLAAFAVYSSPLIELFRQPMVNMGVGIGLLLFLWFGLNPNAMMRQSLNSARLKYYIFTALMGTTLSYVFLMYTGEALLRVFFITAATFGAMSLIGYTTKKDLTGMGSFLIMGVIGILIASVVNIFLKSPGLHFVVSILGVLIFTGLIAYETQQAKRLYNANYADETNHKLAIYSALGLYISFINLFQFLLSLLGNRN